MASVLGRSPYWDQEVVKCQGDNAGYPGFLLLEYGGHTPLSAEAPDIACGHQVEMAKMGQLQLLVRKMKHLSVPVDPAQSPLSHAPIESVGVA